ncbi:tumor protein p53-inducible nuclear protein 2 isoform X1 [Anguilla anguilla]|uniref:tumor protein p53-inducible nuclear protein 2 isoform X1 n=1 Tax=Anguilla anguilla TaxID=7936 RepID=UPI0015AA97F5|nr:tumor protein p53-inducible nuclear protein 2 isoform X1 [Anguilla anguilla]XP_035236560.1 tumor protein p53-inducible nuclear protein 2 isoform X1 [Anguilla anguilla]XP_035236561.1 tumor protein p53-inducible nuclear protein 2 isoform X1 [Anguilla anguilla]
MFQRLSSLFFGEVEDASTDLKGPKPCVTEADEEGWLLVNLPGEDGWVESVKGSTETPAPPCSLAHNDCLVVEPCKPSQTAAPPPCNHRRTKVGVMRAVELSFLVFPDGSEDRAVLFGSSPLPQGSTPASPGSRSDCSSGPERCCMDESWFVTPPPCFTAEGATAETSPMEDLLIEHPSMSVYVSPSNLSIVEESTASLGVSVSMVTDPAPPAVQTNAPRRVTRGTASQAGQLGKVTQMPRVQRAKARADRRHLSRNRLQRQNRVREQAPRHTAHARGSFLHQPCQRSCSH